MGWQDAPIVGGQQSGQPKWASAPVIGEPEAEPAAEPQLRGGFANIPGATLDPLAHLASSAVAAPVAGIAGLGTMGARALGLTDAQPADVVGRVQSALTFQPRTQAGAATTEAVTYPFQKYAQFADWAGQQAANPQAGGNLRANIQSGGVIPKDYAGSPAAGALVNTALQGAPALLFRRSPVEARSSRGVQAELSAEPGMRRAYADVGGGVASQPRRANTVQTPEARARDYVARNTALDWNSLSGAVRETLKQVAADARALERLDPAAFERQARLESLPVPIRGTRGQLSRDPVQLRNEGNVSATEAGRPIRESYVAQNRAILSNLEILRGRFRSEAASPEQVGLSVQDQALRAKLQQQKARVSELYEQAEKTGELQGTASITPIMRTIVQTPDKTHYAWVQSWLESTGAYGRSPAAFKKQPFIQQLPKLKEYTLKELEDLRQAAVARTMNGGTEGYYAGKLIRAIDETTEGAGGKAYQAARQARKQQALEFEDQAAVARLVENKSRTDRSVALEDTWRKTVIGGARADLEAVKRSLLIGGRTPAVRTAGRKAWRDIQAETIRFIENEATKNVQRFEDGTPNVTPAAMERALRAIGPEKLETLFGNGTVRRLREIMEATRIVKTEPPVGFKGSPTFANMLSFLERGLGKIPLVGDTAVGVVKAGIKLREMGREGREVRAAMQTPLEQAAREAKVPR